MDSKHNVFKDGFKLLFYYEDIKNVLKKIKKFFLKVFKLLTSLE